MIDLLKVFQYATPANAKVLYKGLGELSANEVRTVEDLKEYVHKKTWDEMVKRAKL